MIDVCGWLWVIDLVIMGIDGVGIYVFGYG